MRRVSEKYTVLYMLTDYVISSYIKVLLCALAAFAILFAALFFSGLYSQLETILDLKYNSPFVLVPLYGSIALALLCLFIGFLLYFHKYKRSKTNGRFCRTFSNILSEGQAEKD